MLMVDINKHLNDLCILYFVGPNDWKNKNKKKKKERDTHNFTEINDHKSQVVICRSVENEVKSQNRRTSDFRTEKVATS